MKTNQIQKLKYSIINEQKMVFAVVYSNFFVCEQDRRTRYHIEALRFDIKHRGTLDTDAMRDYLLIRITYACAIYIKACNHENKLNKET